MNELYAYPLAQCDIPSERRSKLESYRAKRGLWLSWINSDEHHAIWPVLSEMVWTDASFKLLTNLAMSDETNGLNNRLLMQALLDGHVAIQVLAIRRLMDNGPDIISLRKLLKELKHSWNLFTRENYVCYDGLPYDYESEQLKNLPMHIATGRTWVAASGPTAYLTSRRAHDQFDRLTGIHPTKRNREDRLPKSLVDMLEKWLDDSGADELKDWSHQYLAHAADAQSRKKNAYLRVTADKITNAIKTMSRVTEAVSTYILYHGGRSASLMPVAQFTPFEKLEKPIMKPGAEREAWTRWHQLTDERNHYLDGVEDELIKLEKPIA